MENENLNILFTSVGRRSYLVQYFKDALAGKGKVHVANSSNISPAFQVADQSVVSPLIYDSEYIPFLMNYCKENKINIIISLFDIDLPILAKNKDKFAENGIKVIVSNQSVIDVCNDKWKTYQFLIKNGFNAPKTFLKVEDAISAINNKNIQYPVMIKPRWGMGSIAVYEAENETEMKIFYEVTKRNISKTYLKYEAAENFEQCVLIQEKLDGTEYGLDIINDLEGTYQTTICKHKYAMRSGETDCAVTVDSDCLRHIGSKLSGILHHVGNLDCDVFMVDNEPYILEMNARFGGGYPFSHMAGVNLPMAIINWARGEKVPQELLEAKIGVMAQKDISMVYLNALE
jgi:carbamoyl-phosphate synthase large subunit